MFYVVGVLFSRVEMGEGDGEEYIGKMHEDNDGITGVEQHVEWGSTDRGWDIQVGEGEEWDEKSDRGIWVGAEEGEGREGAMINFNFLIFFLFNSK